MDMLRVSQRRLPVTRSVSPILILALILALVGLAFNHPARANSLAADPAPNLVTSSMTASQATLAPGEHVIVTITLRNTGDADATAGVSVAVPGELAVTAGSITGGGTLTGAVITWNNLTVAAGASVALSFQVGPAGAITTQETIILKAAIQSTGGQFIRFAPIMLTPVLAPAPPELAGSDKAVAHAVLGPEEQQTYTITLRNTGANAATVSVTDPLPDKLALVAGSITGGGAYDTASNTITWEDVNVPAGGAVALSFRVEATVHVIVPVQITNTALITSGGTSFTRSATFTLVLGGDHEPPAPGLGGSSKLASQTTLAPGETLTYTIRLHNSATTAITADVVDPVPAGLTYVADSVTQGGTFAGGQVRWDDVEVPAGQQRDLTFQVTAGAVESATHVTNEATITAGETTLTRKVTILLVPEPLDDDVSPPSVRDVAIEVGGVEQDVLTGRDVTIHTEADDNVGVRWMTVTEWHLASGPPRWELVRSSGWVNFQADYAWRLGPQDGTHFVGVWVGDSAGNVSHVSRAALDSASLVLPGQQIGQRGHVAYLVHYEAGASVSATLTPASGDADLYVWYPGNLGLPDQKSNSAGTTAESVSFSAPQAGTYLFLAFGYTEATYDLSITPAGGTGTAATTQAAITKPGDLAADPVLTQSGLDPLGVAFDPSEPNTVLLPAIFH